MVCLIICSNELKETLHVRAQGMDDEAVVGIIPLKQIGLISISTPQRNQNAGLNDCLLF